MEETRSNRDIKKEIMISSAWAWHSFECIVFGVIAGAFVIVTIIFLSLFLTNPRFIPERHINDDQAVLNNLIDLWIILNDDEGIELLPSSTVPYPQPSALLKVGRVSTQPGPGRIPVYQYRSSVTHNLAPPTSKSEGVHYGLSPIPDTGFQLSPSTPWFYIFASPLVRGNPLVPVFVLSALYAKHSNILDTWSCNVVYSHSIELILASHSFLPIANNVLIGHMVGV